MKKLVVIILVIFLVTVGFGLAQDQQAKQKNDSGRDIVTRTYELKHISSRVVHSTLNAYIVGSSSSKESNLYTVKLRRDNVAAFEKLLEKMDVEKQKILLRIFTVIASKEGKSETIDNKDLQKVLTELKKVLSFKSFKLDGVSAISLVDGQRSSELRLSSSQDLKLHLQNVMLRSKAPHREVQFEFRAGQLNEKESFSTLIHSTTSVKENGFLVAGVSKIGKNGDSLVLIINAVIK